MALKDTWKDLEDAVEGVPDSGSDITVEPINAIAHAVIDNEKEITDNKNRIAELEKNSGGDVDLSNYYTKEETDDFVEIKIAGFDYADKHYVQNEINLAIGDIETLLGGI